VRARDLVLGCLAAAALWGLPAAAQDAAGAGEPGPPAWEEALPLPAALPVAGNQQGVRLELVVHRWSDRGAQDGQGQRFTVSVAEQPAFITNLRWEGGPELEFAPGEHSKVVTLVFDTTAAGATGEPEEDGRLLLRVEAHHEAVTPPERELEVPLHFTRALTPGEAVVAVCALRSDAPEGLAIEQAFAHCDPERTPVLTSDRIVVFFTPARDLGEPIGEDQFFNWRILGPNGDRVAGGEFRDRGTPGAPELTVPFAADGSPGRLAVALDLWSPRDDPDPARARKGPGRYTVQTVDVRMAGSGVLGQGEATPYLDGEWRDEGTFEVGAARLAFAGFVAEDVAELALPGGTYTGVLRIGRPQVSGSAVAVELRASWQTRPDKPEQRAASRLSVRFPPALDPEHEKVGGLDLRLEVLEAPDDSFPLVFTAGVHRLVTTTTAPPDRHLVEGTSIPPLWDAVEYRFADCGGAQWVWTQWEGNPTYDTEATEGSCTIRLELDGVERDDVFGDPPRTLASHLHDPATLWVIPVFYRLSDDPHPWSSGAKLSLRSYGYAIYAAEPYGGPGPAGRPEGGEGAGTETVTGTGAGTETVTGTETGTGTGTGEGTATTVVVPPVPRVDTSDPSRLDPDRQPEVASLVREWLAVAEPPENAVPGVDFRYDELGRKIGGGGTTGRVVSSHATADYGSGASSEARVWSALRRELDSVDHCTLEEYVLARLEERSIEPCRGRYGAVRELGGVPLAAARAEVQGAGFSVTLAPGSPAPSPAAEGTVERQQPPASQHLRRGQALTLIVHAPYVAPAIAAPDVVGLSRPEAKRRLEALGLVAALRPGAPARSPAESDTVEAQEPAAGAPLEPGAAVAIRVRSPFVATATIPGLVGLSTREAKARLAAAGIDAASVDLIPGSPAPSPALAGAVEAQEPPAGATVAPGGRIALRVHSGFVDLRTVPGLIGLALGEARQRLASLGLGAELAPGSPAPSPEAEGTVQQQSPPAGATIDAGAVVTLAIHGPYLPPATPVPPPVPPPPTGAPPADEQPLLSCPQTLYKHAVPGINACANMWWTLAPGSGQVRGTGLRCVVECSYHVPNASPICAVPDRFIEVHWVPAGATGGEGRAQGDYCTEDSYYDSYAANSERMRRGEEPMMIPSHWKLFSRTRKVRVELYEEGWDEQLGLALAREMIGQVEPFAAPCVGAAIPAATPLPPPAPPACPGPAVTVVYDLWNPPPYGGLGGVICEDAAGALWLNIANNIYPVTAIQAGAQDPASGCWPGTGVVTPVHTYGGTLCRKGGGP